MKYFAGFFTLFFPLLVWAQEIEKGSFENISLQKDNISGNFSFDSIDQADGIAFFLSDVDQASVFGRSFLSLAEREDQENSFSFDIKIPPTQEGILTAELLRGDKRIGLAHQTLKNTFYTSPPGMVSDVIALPQSEGILLKGNVTSKENLEALKVDINFYQKNLQNGKFMGYNQVISNIKAGEVTPFELEIPKPFVAKNYFVVIQFISEETIWSEYVFPYTEEGEDFAVFSLVQPPETQRIEGSVMPLSIEGIASSSAPLELEVTWKETLGERKTISQEISPDEAGFFSQEISIEFNPLGSDTLYAALVLKDKETQAVREKATLEWELLPTVKKESAKPLHLQLLHYEPKFNKALFAIFGVFVLALLWRFSRKYWRRFFLLFIGTIPAVSVMAADAFVLNLYQKDGATIQGYGEEFFIEGEILHVLTHESLFESPDYECKSVEIISYKEETQQSHLYEIPCNQISYFKPTPIGSRNAFSIPLINDLEGDSLELSWSFFAGEKTHEFKKELSFPVSEKPFEGCPVGYEKKSQECKRRASCDVFQFRVLASKANVWWKFNPLASSQSWVFSQTQTESCSWGCQEGSTFNEDLNICEKIPQWSAKDWGVCSASCGGGIQEREVLCLDGNKNPVAEENCSTPKPESVQSCNTQPCCIPSGDRVKKIDSWPSLITKKSATFCQKQIPIESCPKSYPRQSQCCTGLSVVRASAVSACNPYQGGDCFTCPDSIKEGSICSGWEEVCF